MSANKEYIYKGDAIEFAGLVKMYDTAGVLITDLTGWSVHCGLKHTPEAGGAGTTPSPSGYLALTAVFTELTPEPKILITGTPAQTDTLAIDDYTFQIRYESPTNKIYSENVIVFQVLQPSTEV